MSDLYNYVDAGYWVNGYTDVLTSITGEIQTLTPSAIIELYEIDATSVGGSVYRFHSGMNELLGDIVWQGNSYSAFPIQASGFDWSGKGQMPRPKVTVSNVLGTITALVLAYQDLVGCKFTRIRTLAKYLDAVNFPTQRNLLTYSQEFDNASWTKTNVTVTAGAALAPDGTMTAETVTASAGTAYHYVYKAASVSAGATYSFSIYVKAGTTRYIGFGDGGDSVWHSAYLDTVTGKIVSQTNCTATATDAGNGWFRVTATFTRTNGGTSWIYVGGSGVTGSAGPYFAATGSETCIAWGAQLEAGSAVTSYQAIGASFSRNPTADPTAEFPRDIFYVDRRSNETNEFVEFELAASLDLAGVALPRRQIIQNYCPWQYRGAECGYTGTNYFDTNDNPVATLAQDVCGKRLSSCRARFGQYGELPYGGFPAAGLLKT